MLPRVPSEVMHSTGEDPPGGAVLHHGGGVLPVPLQSVPRVQVLSKHCHPPVVSIVKLELSTNSREV